LLLNWRNYSGFFRLIAKLCSAQSTPSPFTGLQYVLHVLIDVSSSIAAPIPEGYGKPVFGFPVTTCKSPLLLNTWDLILFVERLFLLCPVDGYSRPVGPYAHVSILCRNRFQANRCLCCGDTPQNNSYKEDWADFFAENRLLSILKRCEAKNGLNCELRDMVERTAGTVVPSLLRKGHLGGSTGVTPCVVHGDLWSGNRSRGLLSGALEDVVFDPSACYAHSEYELGIMRMFGGFSASFLEEYHNLVPRTEPIKEYEDRVRLYELYVV
jgi:hypothetical protein